MMSVVAPYIEHDGDILLLPLSFSHDYECGTVVA